MPGAFMFSSIIKSLSGLQSSSKVQSLTIPNIFSSTATPNQKMLSAPTAAAADQPTATVA